MAAKNHRLLCADVDKRELLNFTSLPSKGFCHSQNDALVSS